jgi:uncharacterized membrane protein HdeD (DUF308 family)
LLKRRSLVRSSISHPTASPKTAASSPVEQRDRGLNGGHRSQIDHSQRALLQVGLWRIGFIVQALCTVNVAYSTTFGASTMTSMTSPFHTTPLLEPLRAKWGWIVALGVVYVIAGLIALSSVVWATVVSVFVVGIMMLIAGVAEVINAFQIQSWSRFIFWLLLGVLYIVAGFVTFENPLLAAAVLTLILGAALVASGIMRIIVAFNVKEETPWLWVLLSGAITLLLGIVILAHWPVSGLFVLGVFLGIDLLVAGIGWISLGLGLKRHSYT